MGIFSLFGKKEREQDAAADTNSSRAKRDMSASRANSDKSGARSQSVKRDTHAARATARKIDEIESEMSSEFIAPTTAQNIPDTIKGGASAKPKQKPAAEKAARAASNSSDTPTTSLPTLPSMGTTTQMLLEGATTIYDVAVPASENAPVIEEAAILFANGQNDIVEQMLCAAISDNNLGNAEHDVWCMLFDLYQSMGKQQEFENLSIAYVNKFETSPPAWVSKSAKGTQGEPQTSKGATPSVPFTGKLDGNCIKHLERVQKLAESHRTLRLEFAKVTEVNPIGCGLLLKILTKLQKSEHDLILVSAPELAKKIRSILEVGRRDETEAPWLLLLEILRLLNLEKEFEEASIDYCVTFEVSPPAFVAPKNKVTTATAEQAQAGAQSEAYMMPAVIEGQIDQLILAIATYSDEHDPAIIDCARLTRVDFNAAGRLLSGIAPFCVKGKTIEFHNVSYLVAALFNVIGLNDIVRILPRKN